MGNFPTQSSYKPMSIWRNLEIFLALLGFRAEQPWSPGEASASGWLAERDVGAGRLRLACGDLLLGFVTF